MTEQGQLQQEIAVLEAQRATLSDAVVDAALEHGKTLALEAVVARY